MATGCSLHLIQPLGFSTSEKACRRAGLDYWPRLAPTEHADWSTFNSTVQPPSQRMWFFSTKAQRPYWNAAYLPGDYFVFGKESAGIPDHLLNNYSDQLVTLPMLPSERSLNLATVVCTGIYEGLRQLIEKGIARVSEGGRLIV